MHRDKKLGLALGILLVGIVAAFFFRNEPRRDTDLPRLEDAQALDEAIQEKPIAPYLPDEHPSELGEATESLAAFDGTEASQASDSSAAGTAASLIDDDWSFLQEGDESDLLAQADPGPPDPIRQHEIPPAPAEIQIDDLNAGWQISDDLSRPGTASRDSGSSQTSDLYRENRPSVRSVSQSRTVEPADERKTTPARPSSYSRTTRSHVGSGTTDTEPISRSAVGPTRPAAVEATSRRTFRVNEYRVQAGDTLTGLASRFLGTHKRYSELYEANRDRMKSADDLQAGMLIRIPQATAARSEPAPTAFEQSEAPATVAEPAVTGTSAAGNSLAEKTTDSDSPQGVSSALERLDELSGFDDELLDGSTSYRSQSDSRDAAASNRASTSQAGSSRASDSRTTNSRSAWSEGTDVDRDREDGLDENQAPFGSDEDFEEPSPAGPIAGRESEVESAGETVARTEEKASSSKVEAKSVSVQSGSSGGTSQTPSRRTPENPYGLYLIEPVETAEEDSEPQPAGPSRAAQTPAVRDSAELRQKFVPARSPLANRRQTSPADISRTEPAVRSRTPEPQETPAARETSDRSEPATDIRPGTWVIRRGDTLEGIAVKVYGRRSAATTIFEANRDQLRNPNLLRPGMELRLPLPTR